MSSMITAAFSKQSGKSRSEISLLILLLIKNDRIQKKSIRNAAAGSVDLISEKNFLYLIAVRTEEMINSIKKVKVKKTP
jgi:hypothetical protein